jgi:PIN domain nuclease of toxin-antitoxin system
MPEVIVLDTHIWIWYINQNFDLFPNHWLKQIERANTIGVSAISCYEITLAHSRGRLTIGLPVQEWLTNSLTASGIELLPLTPEIACRAVSLSEIHKDPFDRLIISTALEYGAKLASVDGLFSSYPELVNTLLKA